MKTSQINFTLSTLIFITGMGLFSGNSITDFLYDIYKGVDTAVPNWVINIWAERTNETGIWIADNQTYKNEQEPIDAYGLHWEYGVGLNHVKGRVYGIKDGEDIGNLWSITEFWDPTDKKLKVIQIGSDGTIGKGEIWQIDNGRIKELQSFVSPDGSSYISGHISWMEHDVNHIESYTVVDEEWIKQRYYNWKLQKKDKIEIPTEYEQIAYMIGQWEVTLGENKARMTFSWGANNRTILYKNEYWPAKLDKWTQENEGLITYNGVKDALVFITSYSDLGSPLMATGEIKFGAEGVIHRDFQCHYKEGADLPWSNNAKAPEGGISISFKQIWSPINENTFIGEFLMLKDGSWEHPLRSSTKLERWSRVMK